MQSVYVVVSEGEEGDIDLEVFSDYSAAFDWANMNFKDYDIEVKEVK